MFRHRAHFLRPTVCCLALCLAQTACAVDQASNPDADWIVVPTSKYVRITPSAFERAGRRIQRFDLVCTRDFDTVKLFLRRPPAVPIEDFTCSVNVNSTQAGVKLGLRLIVPGQKDPRDGRVLRALLPGGSYDKTDEWQMLTVATRPAALASLTRELRAGIGRSDIRLDTAYVDGCLLTAELSRGRTIIEIDGCEYGPVVSPKTMADSGNSTEDTARQPEARITVDRDRILLNGAAAYPRFIPDHLESPAFLRRLGLNVAWLPQLRNAERMQQFINAGLFVMATPPHPEFDPADFSAPLQGLPPLDQTAPLPDAWYLGTSISGDQLPHLLAWAKEVRSADRRMRRPVFADVKTREGVASRLVDSVGISQHALSDFISFGAARNQSYVRQNASAQLSLPWEWIETEHSTGYQTWRTRANAGPAVVEPEQILMQLAACISAGTRGVGFWKTASLETPATANQREVAATIELANLYLIVLEPLLLRGQVDGHIHIKVGPEPAESSQSFLETIVSAGEITRSGYHGSPSGPDAGIINLPGTSLILSAQWDDVSQFVPQAMYSADASMIVGATETASAWNVSPTAVRGLRREPVPGGLMVRLSDFDMFNITVVTANHEELRKLEQRVQLHAERAAQLFVKIAELKLNRVARLTQRIDLLRGPDDHAATGLQTATSELEQARQFLSRRNYNQTEKLARACLRRVRLVQNRYWYRAIQGLPSPMASPHTVSFSTLFDHWTLMRDLELGEPSGNLLPSGDFESVRTLKDSGWNSVVADSSAHQANAEVISERAGRNRILRLRAWNRSSQPAEPSTQPALMVASPVMKVKQGDIIEISARVKTGQGVLNRNMTPLVIFDSDLGPELGVSPKMETSWRTFRMVREISETGDWQLLLGLQSPAEIYVDNLTVINRGQRARQTGPFRQTGNSGRPGHSGSSRVQGADYVNPSLP